MCGSRRALDSRRNILTANEVSAGFYEVSHINFPHILRFKAAVISMENPYRRAGLFINTLLSSYAFWCSYLYVTYIYN